MYPEIVSYFSSTVRGACAQGHTSNFDCTVDRVGRYVGWFTGACFDPRMDEPWWQPDRFNSSDMYGVAALSMPHMIGSKKLEAFCKVFDRDSELASDCDPSCTLHHACILKQIPATADIWDPDAAKYIALANKLWAMLYKKRPGHVGEVGVNKLMSHKRPYLLPVVDDVCRRRMRMSNGDKKPRDHWIYFHEEVQPLRDMLAPLISAVRMAAQVPEWTSDIRVIDIAIWMDEKNHC